MKHTLPRYPPHLWTYLVSAPSGINTAPNIPAKKQEQPTVARFLRRLTSGVKAPDPTAIWVYPKNVQTSLQLQ
jgi:hypothetical protein